MNLRLKPALVYLDDIIIVGRTFEEQLNNIRKVFQRLQKANLKLSPKRCKFFQKEVSYLGHIISSDGVKTGPEKPEAVVDWPRPETLLAQDIVRYLYDVVRYCECRTIS
ncbi:Retrovirus-related Pol polyprotein from transposon 297 [Araneus ventricosus]|uniref:Retrovirus-related Pol polyprotein from transposon 297 n=1 Tax=Araneus ventricosus TaxID=182803 RepID=A0A4Y2FIM9_ARAVE|nr:Retrovirus-related Pol polyprotein from transposon 297 [Araneus ventricosus]